jgi:hypothetical protein
MNIPKGLLKEGSRSQLVKDLQRELKEKGFDPKGVDGQFGPHTEAAVKAFQKAHKLSADGVVGPQTWKALGGDRFEDAKPTKPAPAKPAPSGKPGATTPDVYKGGPINLAPAGWSEKKKYDYYSSIVRAKGGKVDGKMPTVLGLRGLSPSGKHHSSTSAASYDETFVVIKNGHASLYRGATHPGQTRSSMSPDVNGDGVGDVGTIRPGNYVAKPNGPHGGNSSFWVNTVGGSGSLPGYRDTNHDGFYSSSEKSASERRNDKLTGVLFHQGNANAPSSVGCQTMSPSTFSAFLKTVGGGKATFRYTLVDAS